MSDATLVQEVPWRLEVNGRLVAGGTFSPQGADAFAAGRLLADGFLMSSRDLRQLDVEQAKDGVVLLRADVDPERATAALAERDHRESRGCAILHFITCDRLALRRPRRPGLPDTELLRARFQELFGAASEASEAGGMHAAALTDGERLMHVAADVSRHNAVDKALGEAFLVQAPLGDLGVMLTGRITSEIALKAARAGAAWVASRSVATSLALALSEAARLPMIGRAVSGLPHVYAAAMSGDDA